MARRFNTAGPCRPDRHYMIPAERRLPEAPGLVEQEAYFVVHAPRQTGKTTALRALAEQLTASGRCAALYLSCESGEAAGDDFAEAQRAVLAQLRRGAELYLPAALHPPSFPEAPDSALLNTALTAWARACPRPLVLFFDEVDALRGQSLLSVLRQLRPTAPRERLAVKRTMWGLAGRRGWATSARHGRRPAHLLGPAHPAPG